MSSNTDQFREKTADDLLDDRQSEDLANVQLSDFETDVTPTRVGITGSPARSRSQRLKLHCFNCNRIESHSNAYVGAWFYSYLIGITFGLLHVVGPYRCQCCGRERLMFRDWLNPKYYYEMFRHRRTFSPRRAR